MAENKVSVEITLEEKAALKALTQLTKEVNKTEGSFKKMGDEGDKSLGVIGKATEGVSGGFKSLVGGVTIANLASTAIIGVGNQVKEFVLGSINAAIEQENAINRLGAALKRSGEFSESAMLDFRAFANEIQQNSTYGDEIILGQLAIAKSYGLTNERAKQLVQAATELSATFGTSLDSNIKNLGKSFSGLTGELGEALPIIKTLTAEQLRAGGAIDLVNTKFAGAARAELDTYQGSVKALGNAYGDLQEELGAFLTTSTTVSGANSFFKSILEEVTAELRDYRIEMARGNEGFKENAESLDQLTREYAKLTDKIEAAKAVLAESEDPNTGFFKGLFLNTIKAKEDIRELTILQKRLYDQINGASLTVGEDENSGRGPDSAGGITPADQKLIDSRKAAYAELQIAKAEFDAFENEQRLLATEIDSQNREFELQELIAFEQAKIDAKFAAEEQKANLIKDAKTRELTIEKLQNDKYIALQKSQYDSRKKIDAQFVALENQKQAAIQGIMGSAFTLAAALTKDGTKEQFYIQKAAALAEIGIARGKAIALIPAQTAHIPFPGNVPAAATLLTYANIQAALGAATIAASVIKGYENGGIIPGNSYTGDRVPAYVNSGEMILNKQQQSELFNMANGGGSSSKLEGMIVNLIKALESQPINLNIDGRQIATAVRKEVQGGFRLS